MPRQFGAWTLSTRKPVTTPVPAQNNLANAVYLRLMTPLGSYWADPTLGSRLHELQREKDVSRVAVLARQYAEEALAPLVRTAAPTASPFPPCASSPAGWNSTLKWKTPAVASSASSIR